MKRAFPLAGGAPVLVVFICAAAIRSEPQPLATLQEVQAQPHVMFISVLPGAFGRVGLVPLSRPEASPVITDLVCHRLSFAAGQGLCMFKEYEGDRYPAFAFTFRSPMQRERKIDLAGRPSRTRISPGGRYGAMTVFVVGDSYSCDFSTRTTLIDMRDGRAVGDLEKFTVR